MEIQTLLVLPVSSSGFSALPLAPIYLGSDSTSDTGNESGSPPRKVIRLDSDADFSSVARLRKSHIRERQEGSIIIRVVGEPLKPPPPTLYDQNFLLLRQAIRTLLVRDVLDVLPATYEHIYSACSFTVCTANQGERLFETLKMELEQCVSRLAKELTQTSPGAVPWTRLLVQICGWFERQIVGSLLESLLTYLDQSFIRKTTKLPSIHELSFTFFSDRIFLNPQIAEQLRSSIREWITSERQSRPENSMQTLISDLVSHLLTHGQYSSLFEPFYLDITQSFYASESMAHWDMVNVDTGAFIAFVNSRVEEEKQRAKAVLPSRSWKIVEDVTEKALLGGRLEELALKALDLFMDTRRMQELTALYRMFSRVDGLKPLCAAFKAHVTKSVQNIVQAVALDDEMVKRLLDFKSLTDTALAVAFVDDKSATPTAHHNRFSYALIDAFQTGFKARRNKPAEMIAKYMDKAMRETNREISDVEFAKQMDAVLALYRFTDDKDVFRTFYHRALAKRLMLGRTASDDAEKVMLKKLKEQYDPEFGMGDHMFNDLALSREMMRDYSKISANGPSCNLSVMVLQKSVWPFAARQTTIDLPRSMVTELTNFTAFYETKHQGRKLDWDHALGTVVMKAQFAGGSKELSVSLHQAVILLLFNNVMELAFADILAATNMNDAELRRTLQSLACGKKRVLKKSPVGKDVEDGDVFRFNTEFTDPRPKIHINSIQVKETTEESKHTQAVVEGDRKHYLDAAIVRIMKARKELSYEQLKIATIDAVKSHFVPEVTSIKQRIQALVEQDYLKRDEEDMTLYIYVA